MMDEHRLQTDDIPFAIWTEARDPMSGMELPGQGVHRFHRFTQPVVLNRLELPAPTLWPGLRGGAPRHIIVFVYEDDLSQAQVVFDGQLPEIEQGETFPLPLHGVSARAASVLCDERYSIDAPIQAAGAVNHPTTYTLPFTLLDNLRWFGTEVDGKLHEIPFRPPLQRGLIDPHPQANQTVVADAYEVRFTSDYLSVGFSLKRPQLTFLGWDALGSGGVDNYLYRLVQLTRHLTGGNGPYLYDLHYDASPLAWTGWVEVEGNCVRYHDLHIRPGWTVSAEFMVMERSLTLRLQQTVQRTFTALDAAAWGFLWNGRTAALATNAMPIRGKRRNGGVEPRGGWAVPGRGALNFHAEPGHDDLEIQVDTTGFHGRVSMAGLQLATRHEPTGPVTLLEGVHTATLHLDVRAIEPIVRPSVGTLPEGLRRSWGSTFAFRPEAGGFSNNGFSINCQNCLYFQADMAPFTACPPDGPDLIELVRYTASLAVQGGPGYGARWDLAMDAAPSLAISLARVHQVRPDEAWLRQLWPHLRRPLEYILDHLDEAGLYVHPHYSGNSGEGGANCNMWDTICFGHYDAYSGTLAYRALRGGIALARDAGDAALAGRCETAAARLKAAYVPNLLNPKTGLIAGWRSADGEFHDHSYLYVNGIAICYGLVDDDTARAILTTLEAERVNLGHDDFHYGICLNLKPIPRSDYLPRSWGSPALASGEDTFGIYINGSLTPAGAYFYLRALSQFGFTSTADRICEHLLESFARRQFDGGPHSGTEYYTLDGMPCGYEGSLTHIPHVLLAMAQHRGDIETLTPEWWPA